LIKDILAESTNHHEIASSAEMPAARNKTASILEVRSFVFYGGVVLHLDIGERIRLGIIPN